MIKDLRDHGWSFAGQLPDAEKPEHVFADEAEPLGDGEAPWSRWSEEREAAHA